MLRDHQDQFKVVHPQRSVVQLVRIHEEDDVLDCVLDEVRIVNCSAIQSQQELESNPEHTSKFE